MTTVNEQAAKFLVDSLTRRRSPVKPATARAYLSHITRHIGPLLGHKDLKDVENGLAKVFLKELSHMRELKPASINAIFMTLKLIIASAVDENGNQLHPRVWNADFIDLPVIVPAEQDAPTVSREAISEAISQSNGFERGLYALLAGTGLRIGEALALKVSIDKFDPRDSVWCPKRACIYVRSTVSGGKIQDSTKTAAGRRDVDLHPDLNKFLIKAMGPWTPQAFDGELMFVSETGKLACVKTAYQRLAKASITEGFHAFRRFRVTHLRSQEVPEDLIQYWIGHAKAGITDRYSKLSQNLELRKIMVKKAGLGFELGDFCEE